jgi:8-oxo-dGTP pyrophosphatase MutT (NUDIX family)
MTAPDPYATESQHRAAGGVVWQRGTRGPELVLIRRNRRGTDDWSLPKGKLDRGESFAAAALREVEEETGIQARLLRFAGVMQYLVKGENKVVCFWEMQALGPGRALDNGEVTEVRWVTPDEALALLTFEQHRELLRHLPPPPV